MNHVLLTPAPETIIDLLYRSADDLFGAQTELDALRIEYEILLTSLSIDALTAEIFPAKSDPSQVRAALNDRERELAIEHVGQGDPRFMETRLAYEAAQRKVKRLKDMQENARLIAQMMISRLG